MSEMSHEIAMLDMGDVLLVHETGAGWATPMDNDGRIPNMGQLFVITARTSRPEDLGSKDKGLESIYLAFDQESLDNLIVTLAHAMFNPEMQEGGET